MRRGEGKLSDGAPDGGVCEAEARVSDEVRGWKRKGTGTSRVEGISPRNTEGSARYIEGGEEANAGKYNVDAR